MSPRTAEPRRRRSLGFGFGMALLLGRPLVAHAAPPAAELVTCMEAGQRELRTLSAEFTQTSRVKLFKQEMRSEGRLFFERAKPGEPTRLRWEYLRPDPSTMLLVGDSARLRMGDEKRGHVQAFDMARDANLRAIFAQLKLWLGLGDGGAARGAAALESDYELRTGPAKDDKDASVLILAPRPTSVLGKTFARVELTLQGRGCELRRLLLVEQSGDEKEIRFTSVQRNAPLPRPGGRDPFVL